MKINYSVKHYLILRMKKVKKSFDEALFNFKKKNQIMKGKKL